MSNDENDVKILFPPFPRKGSKEEGDLNLITGNGID
jgi:hypothetical protein